LENKGEKKMKTNKDKLVMFSVSGKVHHPTGADRYRINCQTGQGFILPAVGGIVYNYKIGDSCMGIEGDHVEPGVSIKNADLGENNALNMFSCIGNECRILSGDAKGKKGFVTGKHGGIDHVICYFDDETLDLLAVDDKIQIKAYGTGLKLEGYEDIGLMNVDPALLEKMQISLKKDSLEVDVTTIIPAFLMGSGLGASTAQSGDYDVMCFDKEANKKYKLDQLKFGDIVLIEDHYCQYGYNYHKGAVSVGVIVHSDCLQSGHGPGITIIMTCKTNKIKGIITEKANISRYLL